MKTLRNYFVLKLRVRRIRDPGPCVRTLYADRGKELDKLSIMTLNRKPLLSHVENRIGEGKKLKGADDDDGRKVMTKAHSSFKDGPAKKGKEPQISNKSYSSFVLCER